MPAGGMRPLPPSPQQHAIRSKIQQQHDRAQHQLRRPRQSERIEQRNDVMIDESTLVTGLAAGAPQPVLERCERTNPTGVFDQDAPNRRRYVKPRKPRPAEHEHCARDDEDHEREMDGDDRIGKMMVAHISVGPTPTFRLPGFLRRFGYPANHSAYEQSLASIGRVSQMTIEYNILAISGSLRARSSNTETLRAAAMLAEDSLKVSLYGGLATLPLFNPDLDGADALPLPPVRELRRQIAEADAVLICSPEYAHGVPGALKNALDWLVSGPEMVLKPVGLLNVSPRSTYAYEALTEILRTMSTVLVPDACRTVSLEGRGLSAATIAATRELAEALRDVLRALRAGAADYRLRRAELVGTEPSRLTS